MPLHGYTAMFENILDHKNITFMAGVDYDELPKSSFGHTIFTGPVDGFYGHRFGKLPYRSLRFEHETLNQEKVLPAATVNYPSGDIPFTRITEFKQLTGQQHPRTSLCREFPTAEGDPYYPIPNPANQALFKQYEALADAEKDVTFLGRLGTYRYMNMDQGGRPGAVLRAADGPGARAPGRTDPGAGRRTPGRLSRRGRGQRRAWTGTRCRRRGSAPSGWVASKAPPIAGGTGGGSTPSPPRRMTASPPSTIGCWPRWASTPPARRCAGT
jgi:hypothetical protein